MDAEIGEADFAFSVVRFHACTRWPAIASRRAMCAPMMPVPTNPTVSEVVMSHPDARDAHRIITGGNSALNRAK